jgi:hypothetical protein
MLATAFKTRELIADIDRVAAPLAGEVDRHETARLGSAARPR